MTIIEAKCVNPRKNFPWQITVGEKYLIDSNSIYKGIDGAYGDIYSRDGLYIASMKLSHFKIISDPSKGSENIGIQM